MTVYRRPDPIPLRRAPATVAANASAVVAVRTEPDDLNRLVAREIFLAIAGGRFPAGSILPNEHQLASDLGVSRTALREAIKGLAAKGMVETRRKRGTQVMDRGHWNMLDAEVISWSRRSGSPRVSEELWGALVATLPMLAAVAATAPHRQSVIDAVESYFSSQTRDSFAAMLCALAAAGENRFLASLIASVGRSLVTEDPQFLDRMQAQFRPALARHLLSALRQRDSVAVRALVAQGLSVDGVAEIASV